MLSIWVMIKQEFNHPKNHFREKPCNGQCHHRHQKKFNGFPCDVARIPGIESEKFCENKAHHHSSKVSKDDGGSKSNGKLSSQKSGGNNIGCNTRQGNKKIDGKIPDAFRVSQLFH